jgi:hypothetical protein
MSAWAASPSGTAAYAIRLAFADSGACCRRLAEAGCSSHEIMSVSGHEALKEVERYTKAANRAQLANSAIAALKSAQEEAAAETGKQASGLPNTPENVSQSSEQAPDSKEKKNRGWWRGWNKSANPYVIETAL